MERGILVGVSALRWALWLWIAAVALANLDERHFPAVAVAVVVATGVVTAVTFLAPRGEGWRRALGGRLIALEVGVAGVALVAEALVDQGRRSGQGLSGNWPLAGVLVAATATGPVGGAAVGGLLGLARTAGVLLDPPAAERATREALGALSTTLVWVAVGAVMGRIVQVLRETRDELAEARAREQVARRLHDGVLQVLALVERRSTDPALARIAREQDLALRAYLAGDHERPEDLPAALRALALATERDTGLTVRLSLTADLPDPAPPVVEALVGAVGEALANAAKHGLARQVVIFADVADAGDGEEAGEAIEVTVKDDGVGFSPAATPEGFGISRSIRGRIDEVGGRVELRSRPGSGTEVLLVAPVASGARR